MKKTSTNVQAIYQVKCFALFLLFFFVCCFFFFLFWWIFVLSLSLLLCYSFSFCIVVVLLLSCFICLFLFLFLFLFFFEMCYDCVSDCLPVNYLFSFQKTIFFCLNLLFVFCLFNFCCFYPLCSSNKRYQ